MIKRFFIAAVKFYQKNISPYKKPCCRFSPTCSSYAIQAFNEWGAFCGLFLTLWRILRCNPLCRGGYDPVPVRNTHRRKK